MTTPDALFATVLTVDLDAVADNWRLLNSKLKSGRAGAAVKADGYGLGVRPVVRALWAAGCRDFFVAHPDEGLAVRAELPDAVVHILNGLIPEAAADYTAHGLIPVLNDLGQIDAWRDHCGLVGRALPADVHLDTGMCRLGLDLGETETLLADADARLDGIDVRFVMSHLASADDAKSDQSKRQLDLYRRIRARLGRGQASFANSSGIFLGGDYHFDLARPGIALYGGNPTPDAPNPMRTPVKLMARILQVRDVDAPETVGYGANYRVEKPRIIATVPVGYADGYHRAGSNTGTAYLGDTAVPIVGRVSMDLITIDVTDAPPDVRRPGAWVEMIGPRRTPDDIATEWGTISYEVLTGLGRRYRRQYSGTGA